MRTRIVDFDATGLPPEVSRLFGLAVDKAWVVPEPKLRMLLRFGDIILMVEGVKAIPGYGISFMCGSRRPEFPQTEIDAELSQYAAREVTDEMDLRNRAFTGVNKEGCLEFGEGEILIAIRANGIYAMRPE